MSSPTRRLLIVGCARSGTGYASGLLRSLDLDIGHEEVFGPKDGMTPGPHTSEVPHDVSWLAAPHIPRLGPEWVVLHQVRDPRLVAGSAIGLGMFESRTWQAHKLRFWVESKRTRSAPKQSGPSYVKCAYTGAPAISRQRSPVARAFRYWHDWNKLIEEHITAERDYERYRTDQIDAAWLANVFDRLEMESPGPAAINRALATHDRTSNRRGTPPRHELEDVSDQTLINDVRRMATRYGFTGI